MSVDAVIGVQHEQEGTEHTTLGSSSFEHHSGGGVTANCHTRKCGTQGDSIECWAQITVFRNRCYFQSAGL